MELYLDNAATTYVNEEVLEYYYDILKKYFASTGSLHKLGQESLAKEMEAKYKIASLLNVKPSEILFNSGATEGNNYAIKGVALNYKKRGNTIITSKVEHPSVLECFKQLEKDFNFNCIYLDVNEDGTIDLEQLKKSLNDDVILVSIMYVNHEVGTIMPIKEIHEILKKYPKVIFHSDITQAICKCDVNLNYVDIATMSGHKIHGLKGSGFMYKKEKVNLYELISGHPANNAMRAGTSPWMNYLALAKALELSLKFYKNNYLKLKECQLKIIDELSKIDGIVINTVLNKSIYSIINFSAINYNSEVLIRALSLKGIYVSSRSVCTTSKESQVSLTLNAMHKDYNVTVSSIRVSLDKPLNDDEIDYFITSLKEVLKSTRK